VAKSSWKIKTRDNKARKWVRKLRRAPITLRVGVLMPEANQTHPNSPGTTIGEIAIYNEFGTGTIPARSFARGWADENNAKIITDLTKVARDSMLKGKDEKIALAKKGKTYANSMKRRIKAVIRPLNSINTLPHKKGDTPLIDTKLLFKAIKFTVEQ